jgi:hypothetical protein
LRCAKQNGVKNSFEEKRGAFQQFFSFPRVHPEKSADLLTAHPAQPALQDKAARRSGNAAHKNKKNLSTAWTWGRNNRPLRVRLFIQRKDQLSLLWLKAIPNGADVDLCLNADPLFFGDPRLSVH